MKNTVQKAIEGIIPFLIIGIGIALLIALFFVFFYLAIWGILIGGILYLAALAKNYFFPRKPAIKEKGRVIEHDDN